MRFAEDLDLIRSLEESRLLGIVRADSAEAGLARGRRALSLGVDVLEISTTTPGWDRVLSTLRQENPAARLGAGTVLDAETADTAKRAGASFLLSPGLPVHLEAVVETGLPFIPGVMTPSEVAIAADAGARVMKLFPAEAVGPEVIEDLRAPFPDVQFIAVGRVHKRGLDAWVDAGALAIGVGSGLEQLLSERALLRTDESGGSR